MGAKVLQFIQNILLMLWFFILYQIATTVFMVYTIFKWHDLAAYITLLVIGVIASAAVIYFTDDFYRKQGSVNIPVIKDHTFNYKLVVLIIALAAMTISTLLENFIPTSENQTIIAQMLAGDKVGMIISTVLVAPVVEELIFRGLLQKLFFKKMDSVKSVVIFVLVSGILFGFIHTFNFSLEIIPYASAGVIFALTYVFTKDVRYGMILHAINNLIGILSLLKIF